MKDAKKFAELPPDPMDELLAAAMRLRPELPPPPHLVSEALRRGQACVINDARLAHLARIRLWARVSTAAAMLLVTATLFAGYRLWPTSIATDTTTTDTSTSLFTFDLPTAGITVLLVTLIAVVGLALFTTERPQIRTMAG